MRQKNILSLFMACFMVVYVLLPSLATANAANGFPPFSGGSGSEQSPYLILTKEDLEALSQLSATGEKCAGIYFAQTRSIELSGSWTPIKEFCGVYSGGSNEISGLSCSSETDCTGLFGTIDTGAQLKNIIISEAYVSGVNKVGALVGYHKGGTITKCYATGVVEGSSEIGGLVGCSSFGSITDSSAICNVTGTGDTSYAGGLVGNNQCNISRSYSAGNVKGRWYCGGLAGNNKIGTISSCYSSSDVEDTSGSSLYLGGLVGRNELASTITNCYTTGNVTGYSFIGGITGNNLGTISFCYVTGKIRGDYDSPISGVSLGGSCNYSYYLSDVNLPGYTGEMTCVQMSDGENFEGWDFDTIWKIGLDSAYDFPTLGLGGSVIAIQSSGGTISPQKNKIYSPGSFVTSTISPSYGYALKEVFVDNDSKGVINRIDFSNLQTTHKISAVFQKVFRLVPGSYLYIDRTNGLLVSREDNLTVSDIISQFSSTDVVLVKNDVQLVQDDSAGTGCTVNLIVEDEIHDSLTLVILGDTDGDGRVKINDVRKTLRVAVGLESFNDAPFEFAANVIDSDQDIKIDDVRLLLRVAVGLQSFEVPV